MKRFTIALGSDHAGFAYKEAIKAMLTKALGDDKAANLISRILQGGDTAGIESLKWMDAATVADLIKNEHPQIIATILVPNAFYAAQRGDDLGTFCGVALLSAVPMFMAEARRHHRHIHELQALRDQFGSVDGDWPSGPFAAGLYSLIEQGISDRWHDNAEGLWDDWTAQLDTKQCRELALSLADAEQQSGKQPGSQDAQEQG